MKNPQLLTSNSDRWWTPDDLLDEIRAFLGDYYDPCPALAEGDPLVDGLTVPWGHGPVFLNPPYGRTIHKWVRKWREEPMSEGILLVPSRTGTLWFYPLRLFTICNIVRRLHFSNHPTGATFDSALIYRGPRWLEFVQAFEHRGWFSWAVLERGA